jgi:hypothetical protein
MKPSATHMKGKIEGLIYTLADAAAEHAINLVKVRCGPRVPDENLARIYTKVYSLVLGECDEIVRGVTEIVLDEAGEWIDLTDEKDR